jgi:hypothetical protein
MTKEKIFVFIRNQLHLDCYDDDKQVYSLLYIDDHPGSMHN